MNKKIIVVCLLTFLIGCVGGGTLAYANHQKGLADQSLLASISKTQDDWEVEQFIRNQEEQRPEGLEESQIATGSKYAGITYNNVTVASASTTVTETDDTTTKITSNTPNNTSNGEKQMGRVDIQSGSLNIRAASSIDGEVIGQAYKDEVLEIVGQDGVWYQVITNDGVKGYVQPDCSASAFSESFRLEYRSDPIRGHCSMPSSFDPEEPWCCHLQESAEFQ